MGSKLLNNHLDPGDWDAMADYIGDFAAQEVTELAQSLKGKVWQPVPDEVKQLFASEQVPLKESELSQVVDTYRQNIRPYQNGNTHPRFFGWVQGNGTLPAMMADIAVSSMNSNSGGRDHGAVYVERQVVNWCKQLFEFPAQSGGLVTSGTSSSTHLALQVAIFKKLGLDYKNRGFFGVNKPLRCYTSEEGHSSIIKAFQTSGIGSDNLVVIATNDHHQILLDELEARIQQDIAQGFTPFMVIANAGTVNTGAFDDFCKVRKLCDDYDCWMHIDGAFGAWMKIADKQHQVLTKGLGSADSLAFDFHKLMYIQYACGGLLIRDGDFQQQVFSIRPNYLAPHGQALAGGDPWFCDYGLELSRSFRALKIWFTLKTYGIEKLGHAISENCRQATYLGELIHRSNHFELVNQPASTILTFKISGREDIESNNTLCEAIVTRLQLDGEAVFSLTRVDDFRVIRASITNHRTRDSDLEQVVKRLDELATELQ